MAGKKIGDHDVKGDGKNTLINTHWENAASGMPTKMSNAAKHKVGHSGMAVDAGKKPKEHYGTCTHAVPNNQGSIKDPHTGVTLSHPVNWWYVDLGEKKLIKEVHVTNTECE